MPLRIQVSVKVNHISKGGPVCNAMGLATTICRVVALCKKNPGYSVLGGNINVGAVYDRYTVTSIPI